MNRKPLASQPHTPDSARRRARKQLKSSLCNLATALTCALLLLPTVATAAMPEQVGDEYLNNPLPAEHQNSTADAHRRELSFIAQNIIDPNSALWEGAPALRLNRGHFVDVLAAEAIAGAGDRETAAAALADGSLHILGQTACRTARTPEGQPALCLALAKRGGILAAWAQGVSDLIFFELGTPGCAATMAKAPFSGEADIALSSGGDILAARDHTGALWLGPRGGELRIVSTLPGRVALLGFTEAGGALVAVLEDGRGGVWNARTGQIMRSLNISGGPFVSGALQGPDALLHRRQGGLIRWNLTQNAADISDDEHEAVSWTELRGGRLLLFSSTKTWRARAQDSPVSPMLEWSAKKQSLRLLDVDGSVRYYDALSGKPALQVFAEDWANVSIDDQGRAEVAGRSFRFYDRIETSSQNGNPVYCRVLSEDSVLLWTNRRANGDIRVSVLPKDAADPLRKVVDAPLSLPWRTDLNNQTPTRSLRVK
jgi:hypothetical protein